MRRKNSIELRCLLSIKKRFESLQRKEQIQLCGIVFMCYILVFVFYKDISHTFFPKRLKTTQKVFYDSVKVQHKRVSNLEVYRYLNSAVKKYDIDLIETKITQNSMKIDFRGSFTNVISFMSKYEENFRIESYEMEQIVDNRIALSLSVNIEKFYEDKNMKKNNMKAIKAINPYILEASKIATRRTSLAIRTNPINKENHNITINAILGSEVLIDEKWYTIDDIYKHFRIKEIGKRSVVFIDTKTKKEMIKRITNE